MSASGAEGRRRFLEELGVTTTKAGAPRGLPGLTMETVFEGASSRARLDDVAEPRPAGATTQGELRWFAFQVDSRNTANAFYTVTVEATGAVAAADVIVASCSCPFDSASGWCKHIVKSLVALVDVDAPPPPTPTESPTRSPLTKRRRPTPSPSERPRACARCGQLFLRTDRDTCVMPHPPRCLTENGRCTRCNNLVVASLHCFSGTHEPALAAVDAEGWPSDSDESD